MQDVINQLFAARDAAHKLHLSSRSFAKHIALGDLYEKLVEKTDELAEVWQGQHGIMTIGGNLISLNQEDPVAFIRQLVAWAESIKDYLAPEQTHILNIWDEILAMIYRTKYKLENLA